MPQDIVTKVQQTENEMTRGPIRRLLGRFESQLLATGVLTIIDDHLSSALACSQSYFPYSGHWALCHRNPQHITSAIELGCVICICFLFMMGRRVYFSGNRTLSLRVLSVVVLMWATCTLFGLLLFFTGELPSVSAIVLVSFLPPPTLADADVLIGTYAQ